MTVPEQEDMQLNHGTILKELSDIKASLAVNTSETANIKSSVNEIKVTIKEIQHDFVNRREFTEGIMAVREEINPIRKIVYGMVGLILIAFVGAMVSFVLK